LKKIFFSVVHKVVLGPYTFFVESSTNFEPILGPFGWQYEVNAAAIKNIIQNFLLDTSKNKNQFMNYEFVVKMSSELKIILSNSLPSFRKKV